MLIEVEMKEIKKKDHHDLKIENHDKSIQQNHSPHLTLYSPRMVCDPVSSRSNPLDDDSLTSAIKV